MIKDYFKEMIIMPCKETPMKISEMHIMDASTGKVIADWSNCIGSLICQPVSHTVHKVTEIIDVKVINKKVLVSNIILSLTPF